MTDNKTGLIWQGCASGLSDPACGTGTVAAVDWPSALAYCAGLDWGGFSDWRLPSLNEVTSLLAYDRQNPAIDAASFPATPAGPCWTSTAYEFSPSATWCAGFSGTGGAGLCPAGWTASVLCVRAGT